MMWLKKEISSVVRMVAVVACAVTCADAFAASEKVNGITWQYYVKNGEAIVGIDPSSDIFSLKSVAAIPTTTRGKITVPSTLGGRPVTTIDGGAFWSCEQITSVVIPEGVVNLGSDLGGVPISEVFYKCSALVSVIFPDSLKTIGMDTFHECPNLTSISIPVGVESITSPIAVNCPKLASVSVAPGNMHFRTVDGVLYDYEVKELICVPGARTSLRIPASVNDIGSGALRYASSLKEVVVDDANRVYSSKKGLLFDKSGKTLQECPGGLMRLEIPEGTTAIARLACGGALTYVSIPASVVEMDDSVFEFSKLSRIDVAADNPKYSSTGDMLLDKAKTTLIWSVRTSKVLTVPASVKTIRQFAFSMVLANDYDNLQTLIFQGPPPEVSFAEDEFVNLAFCTGSLKGYYTAYEAEWKAVLTNGKWNGLPMTYDPKAGQGNGKGTGENPEDASEEAGFEDKHTFNGLVYDSNAMSGMIQVSTTKKDKKGNVKVGGFVMLSDGKKQTIKTASGAVSDGTVSIGSSVGKLGTLDLVVTEEGFEGTLGDMTVKSEAVGEDTGILSGTLKLSYFDAKTGKVKTKSMTVGGVSTGDAAAGTLTVKTDGTKEFVAEIQ